MIEKGGHDNWNYGTVTVNYDTQSRNGKIIIQVRMIAVPVPNIKSLFINWALSMQQDLRIIQLSDNS